MTSTITRPTLIERIRDAKLRRDDKGLALLDVLIGMAIFALIVIIAIQSISQFRQRAYATGASSDAQQLSVGIEGALTDTQAMPTLAAGDTSGSANLTALGVNFTKNDKLGWVFNNGATDYVFCVQHGTAGAAAYYDSSKGAVTKTVRGSACATAATYAAGQTAAN